METALWHKVTDQEKEEIKKNAKKILDEFAKKLEKLKVDGEHFSVDSGFRDEGEPWKTDEEFRDTIFSNAPDSGEGFITAEKGGWK
jgi:Asp-tRNA(Asn)/Glu-tRNA(Gln) amidotransferase C subunit